MNIIFRALSSLKNVVYQLRVLRKQPHCFIKQLVLKLTKLTQFNQLKSKINRLIFFLKTYFSLN